MSDQMHAMTVKMSTHTREVLQCGIRIPVTLIRIDVLDVTGAFEYRFETIDHSAAREKLKELGYAFVSSPVK